MILSHNSRAIMDRMMIPSHNWTFPEVKVIFQVELVVRLLTPLLLLPSFKNLAMKIKKRKIMHYLMDKEEKQVEILLCLKLVQNVVFMKLCVNI